MTSEDRLVEIRDLLAKLLDQTRDNARKQDVVIAEYRAALAQQRKMQRFGFVVILMLIALLATLTATIYL